MLIYNDKLLQILENYRTNCNLQFIRQRVYFKSNYKAIDNGLDIPANVLFKVEGEKSKEKNNVQVMNINVTKSKSTENNRIV